MLYLFILVAWLLEGDAVVTATINFTAFGEEDYGVCNIWKNMTKTVCEYVRQHEDLCEGGGYMQWTQYVECESTAGEKIGMIVAGVVWMLVLFAIMTTTADDFFSPNIVAIVANLKISESIAGVTFMAFGNGAPDIFNSIASVLNSPKPKAGIALGGLLGAGIFVTSVVTATIILVKPFKIDVCSTIRDLIFYLIALACITLAFLCSTNVYVWEPAGFLALYAVYILTVILVHHLHKRRRKKLAINVIQTKQSIASYGSVHPDIPNIQTTVDAAARFKRLDSYDMVAARGMMKKNSIAIILNTVLPESAYVRPEDREQGKDFDESTEEEFVIFHNKVLTGSQARKMTTSQAPPPIKIVSTLTIFHDVIEHIHPLPEGWNKLGMFGKMLSIIKAPAILLLKVTVPLNEHSWSKAMAIVHALLAPQWFLFAIQKITLQPFDGSPGLYAYALILSAISIILLASFTSVNKQPKYYKGFASYLGFLLSISWIYLISSEVVNVVTMIGVVSTVSHEILGLTILAWSSSIGDLIADISVVRQGYPRMAMAAAIGGPLFNFLIGFGVPFLIATAAGRAVTIELNPTYKVLLLFLFISLTTILIACFVQRFYLRRPLAFILIFIYLIFIVMVILSGTQVLVWN